jgi:hypothetical protein
MSSSQPCASLVYNRGRLAFGGGRNTCRGFNVGCVFPRFCGDRFRDRGLVLFNRPNMAKASNAVIDLFLQERQALRRRLAICCLPHTLPQSRKRCR